MPCEVCDHTVQNIGADGRRIFWCPRCGSLRIEMGDHVETQAPMLVKRVKDAIETSTANYSEAIGRKG